MAGVNAPEIRIGCSGWMYRHWRGLFYPGDLPQSRWLEFYARRFDTVEVNNTFYHLPDAAAFAAWKRRAPAGFVYALKASRLMTHMKKLKDPDEPLRRFFGLARTLGRSLGPILYQLPPRWPVNLERLAAFLHALPKRRRHAFEFREPSWYSEDVYALLRKHHAALCLHDMAGSAPARIAVGPFVYVRFHGTTKYAGRYSDRTIDGWAAWLAERVQDGVSCYAYFNNDAGGQAPVDAERLRTMMARRITMPVHV